MCIAKGGNLSGLGWRLKHAPLTAHNGSGMLKYMRCYTLAFVAMLAVGAAANAQVPGRDLLAFPIGALAEPDALASGLGDGFRNPATALLNGTERARFGIGALDTSPAQGLTAQHFAAAIAMSNGLTVAGSLVRASVDGLVRTDTDPSSLGDVRYDTYVLSGVVARRETSHVVEGVAMRVRVGSIDGETRSVVGLDGGLVADRLLGIDGRVALSTYLYTPTGAPSEPLTWNVAADFRAAGRDSSAQARLGVSWSTTRDYSDERFAYAAGRLGALDLRAGVGRVSVYNEVSYRGRVGVGLHYGRFGFVVTREESGADLSPTYQFALSTSIK